MSRIGWSLLFILIAVCVYASVNTEHMATASGHTLGPSTSVNSTAYADMVAEELGQVIATPGVATSAASTSDAAPTPPPAPATTMTCRQLQDRFTTAALNMDVVPSFNDFPPGCKPPAWFPQDPSDVATVRTLIDYSSPPERFNAAAAALAGQPSGTSSADEPLFPNPPPQCPPRRPFVPGKGCVGSNGKTSKPMCFDEAPYIPDPEGKTIGTCGPVPEPKRATQNRAPPPEGPPGGYSDEGTPARVARPALTGLQVGGPSDGGIGPSTTSGNRTWGGDGVKYPNLLGPNPKDENLPDNNMTASLTLPTPCQVGADGNTLYAPGCRAPTDLGYFTLPSIPKTEGNPSPFSGDYTVFMR
jgi:hypothetical protein